MSPRPLYWKPKYPTRSMRERAWARQDTAREQALRHARPPSRLARLLRRLRGDR